MKSIAFVGKAGSGKTTAAKVLERGYGYSRMTLAAPLKAAAVLLWGEGAMMDRDKLQKLGYAVREIDEDTLINRLLANDDDEDLTVVDDCRFPNEYWKLTEHDYAIVRLNVPEELRVSRLMRDNKLQDREQLNHISETALDNYQADHEMWIYEDDIEVYEEALKELMLSMNWKQP